MHTFPGHRCLGTDNMSVCVSPPLPREDQGMWAALCSLGNPQRTAHSLALKTHLISVCVTKSDE